MHQLKFLFAKNFVIRFAAILILLIFYGFLYKLLIPRITAFGCFDDCFNFGGGYFLLHGKMLFSQIFFNHAPFMAHLSSFIQNTTRPENLFALILRHRQFLLIFGFVCESVLLLRFGIAILPIAIIYELTKFYFFGDRFLGEAFIVYPLMYMLGLVFDKYTKNHLIALDYFLVSLCLWFVFFTREPYILAALFLATLIVWGREDKKSKFIAGAMLIFLSLGTVLSYNMPELFFNVWSVNTTLFVPGKNLFVNTLIQGFAYPLFIFFYGQWNFIRYVEIALSVVFLLSNIFFLHKSRLKILTAVWIILGLANLRVIQPGDEYYAAFHLLPWYALFIFATVFLVWQVKLWSKALFAVEISIFAAIVAFVTFSPGSYTHDKIDEQTEFITNYSNVLQVGNVVAALSNPRDTLFLDGSEDMIYVVAKRYSPYQYSWYTSRMPEYTKYTNARLYMFKTSPPDFYYGSCPKQKDPHFLLPDFIANEYTRLYNLKNPSCLWVKKSKLSTISKNQWEKAGESLYFQTPTTR
ncbi:MAG TPA: hypothetical protein VLB73_01670 [Patescibacteria group bacterium]|nr:hypothetical protein [Patescibacteria group bacterium]